MVVCAVLWSIAGVFIGLLNLNGFVIAGGRSLFAALTVLAYMALTKQRIILSRDTIVSGILLCGVFICFVVANKYTTAANAIVLQYTAPIFILLFSFLFLHKKPRALDVVTVLLTLGGISLFFFDSLDAGKLIGNLLASTNENNPAVIAAKKAGADFIPYDYTVPLVVFASFGVVALLFAIYLKALDKKKGFGLEEPNIK